MTAANADLSARPFTGMPLDRAETERKDPARVARMLRDPVARGLVAGEDSVLLGDGALARVELRSSLEGPILLGLEDGHPLFGLDLEALAEEDRAELISCGRLVSLREAGATLPRGEGGLAAYLAALLGWHRRHRFCANCGAGTTIEQAGYSRHCPRCGMDHFPRTDPVVIMAIEHRGRLLLGRRASSLPERYSVLAGFVSPGESAEEAVIREVREESGIVAHDPRFVTSQPWPFPSSLMLGFEAEADRGEPQARDGELAEVRWFALEDVRAAVRDEHPKLQLPPPVSVARFLIERWVARQGD